MLPTRNKTSVREKARPLSKDIPSFVKRQPSRPEQKDTLNEGNHIGRRGRNTNLRRDASKTKAYDRDRWQANPVAYHEDIHSTRNYGIYRLPGLQGIRNQRIFRQL